MRALITGATGFIGQRLLERIDEPVVLIASCRTRARQKLGGIEVHAWDLMSGPAAGRGLSRRRGGVSLGGRAGGGRTLEHRQEAADHATAARSARRTW